VLLAAWSLAIPVAAAPTLPRLGPAPNFALTTQQDDRLWLTQLRGRAVVLAFGCTACGACPGLVPGLAALAGRLGDAPGRRLFFVLVTVDPVRDTWRTLREFGHDHGLRAPAWLLLTGGRAGEIEVVTRRYGVAMPRPGDPGDCAVRLVDGAGQIRARYDGALDLPRLEADTRALLAEPARP
jgi:protein SCO1/2